MTRGAITFDASSALQKTVKLRYLNMRSSCVTARQLHYMATYCTQLVSLNLYGCEKILKKVSEKLSNTI